MYLADVERYIENIDEFCEKKRMHFLKEMKNKMHWDEYKGFLSNLEVCKMWEGSKLIEEGKYNNFHYILVEGGVAAYH